MNLKFETNVNDRIVLIINVDFIHLIFRILNFRYDLSEKHYMHRIDMKFKNLNQLKII